MEPEIVRISGKKLVGKRLNMSLADNSTAALWRSFMPERNKIAYRLNADLISMRVYQLPTVLSDPEQRFDKWAAAEVSDFEAIPDGMESFVLPGGLYAVFHYKGLNTDDRIYRYIYGAWLPASEYLLDERPHFEVLGARYRNNDPDSEEDIWIPVKPKSGG